MLKGCWVREKEAIDYHTTTPVLVAARAGAAATRGWGRGSNCTSGVGVGNVWLAAGAR